MLLYLAGGHVFSPTEYAALTTAVLFLTIPRPQAAQKGSPCRVTFENRLLFLIIIILYNALSIGSRQPRARSIKLPCHRHIFYHIPPFRKPC